MASRSLVVSVAMLVASAGCASTTTRTDHSETTRSSTTAGATATTSSIQVATTANATTSTRPTSPVTMTTTRPTSSTTTSALTTTTTAPEAATGTGSVDASLDGIRGRVVSIDPGHNGANGRHTAEINRLVDIGNGKKACNTTGTASNAGYSEASFNFDVATRVTALLRAAGATVVMTRTDNDGWGPCINVRAGIANAAHADAAVSIHADGAAASDRGFHVIRPLAVPGVNDRIVEPSARLAARLRAAFEPIAGLPPSNYIGRDGLIERNDLGGLNLAQVPAVFIECGNMRNAADIAVLASDSGRQRIARGVAAGIASYLRST